MHYKNDTIKLSDFIFIESYVFPNSSVSHKFCVIIKYMFSFKKYLSDNM